LDHGDINRQIQLPKKIASNPQNPGRII